VFAAARVDAHVLKRQMKVWDVGPHLGLGVVVGGADNVGGPANLSRVSSLLRGFTQKFEGTCRVHRFWEGETVLEGDRKGGAQTVHVCGGDMGVEWCMQKSAEKAGDRVRGGLTFFLPSSLRATMLTANSTCSDSGSTSGPNVVMLALRASPAHQIGHKGSRAQ
jgi:hypothetical protein